MMNLEKLKDHVLIKTYLAGNELAFDVLIRRHKNEIFQRIFLIVKDRPIAEDVLQDTLMKIVR